MDFKMNIQVNEKKECLISTICNIDGNEEYIAIILGDIYPISYAKKKLEEQIQKIIDYRK